MFGPLRERIDDAVRKVEALLVSQIVFFFPFFKVSGCGSVTPWWWL